MLRGLIDRFLRKLSPTAPPELSVLKLDPPRSWRGQYPDVPEPDSDLSVQLIAARWRCNDIYGEDMRGIAADLLEAGFDSPSLRRLAGEIATCSADVEELVAKVIREFGLPYPMPEEQAQLIFARQLAREVIASRRLPWSAAYELECAMWGKYPKNEDLASIFALNDEWKWEGEAQRYVPVGTDELIGVLARLGSMSDAEIFSVR